MWEKTHTSGGRNVVSVTGVGTQRRHTGGVQECRFLFTQNKEESGPETAECVRTSTKRAQRPLHSLHFLWLLPSEPTPARLCPHLAPLLYVQHTTGLLVQPFLLQAAQTCHSIPTPNASPSSALLVVLAF